MTIKQIYELAIKMGIAADPRGKAGVKKELERQKKKFARLTQSEQAEFDQERLRHPYADTRILVGSPETKVKRILAGIDIDPAEVLLADHLPHQIDLILAHHPLGQALASLDEVMHLQADLLNQYGVPINVAESILRNRIGEVSRSLSAANHNQTVDTARLLHQNLMCAHTATDNLVYQFIKKYLDEKKPETVGEIVDVLKKIPEYAQAVKYNAGPKIFTGSPENRAGKIAVTEVTGGTEGAKEIYEKMSQAGIGTVIGMHMKEEHREEAQKHHINVVIAGHISSDSLGMNLLLDELEKKGIEIIPCSGLIRVKRITKQ